jgi:hypothetical protein
MYPVTSISPCVLTVCTLGPFPLHRQGMPIYFHAFSCITQGSPYVFMAWSCACCYTHKIAPDFTSSSPYAPWGDGLRLISRTSSRRETWQVWSFAPGPPSMFGAFRFYNLWRIRPFPGKKLRHADNMFRAIQGLDNAPDGVSSLAINAWTESYHAVLSRDVTLRVNNRRKSANFATRLYVRKPLCTVALHI